MLSAQIAYPAATVALVCLIAVAYALARFRKGARLPDFAPRPAAQIRTAAVSEAPLTRDEHWRRASGVVETATQRMSAMCNHQKAAAGHLDSADYALQQLKDELSKVMPVAPRAPAGTLHQLKAIPQRHTARPGKAEAA